jgi:hypothetical protein
VAPTPVDPPGHDRRGRRSGETGRARRSVKAEGAASVGGGGSRVTDRGGRTGPPFEYSGRSTVDPLAPEGRHFAYAHAHRDTVSCTEST